MAQRIGEILVQAGLLTSEQVGVVLAAQKTGDNRPFGEVALSMGLIEDTSLRRLADHFDLAGDDRR